MGPRNSCLLPEASCITLKKKKTSGQVYRHQSQTPAGGPEASGLPTRQPQVPGSRWASGSSQSPWRCVFRKSQVLLLGRCCLLLSIFATQVRAQFPSEISVRGYVPEIASSELSSHLTPSSATPQLPLQTFQLVQLPGVWLLRRLLDAEHDVHGGLLCCRNLGLGCPGLGPPIAPPVLRTTSWRPLLTLHTRPGPACPWSSSQQTQAQPLRGGPALNLRAESQGGVLLKEAHPPLPLQETRVQSPQSSGTLAIIHLQPCGRPEAKPPGDLPRKAPGSAWALQNSTCLLYTSDAADERK